MKNIRHASSRSLLVLALASLCVAAVATSARAQSRDERFISAKAGGVNFVSGKVAAKRSGETEWFPLTTNDDLKSGDVLKTGPDGRAEVLLNPGSYLRIGGNTEVKLVDASLDDLRLGLAGGSAVIEATGYSELDLSIVVETPQTQVRIARSGIYRLDVLPSNVTELTVHKGRAYVGQPEVRVKGGKVVRVGAAGAAPEVAKLDKKERDALDLWSRERGKELAKINEKLSRRNTNALLASTNFDNMFSFGNRYSPSGVWFRSGNCYTFLPFYSYWRSPYGYGYGNQLYAPYGFPCRNCNGGYVNPTVAGGGSTNGGYAQPGGGGSTQPSSGGPSRVAPSQPREPRSFESPRSIQTPRERPVRETMPQRPTRPDQ